MAERDTIVDKLRITYEGLFDVTELYKMIDKYLRDKGYDKCEKKNIERVTPEGKFIEIELLPWKKITDYARNAMKIRIVIDNLKDVEIERDGIKVKLNQGKVQFVIDGFLDTDYEHRWEGKPMFYFIRTIFDKYIYKVYNQGYHANIQEDVNMLVNQIKSFLNLYKFSTQAQTAPNPKVI